MRYHANQLIFSPTDLVRYVASPFASWMDRYYLEDPSALTPDPESADKKLIARTGDEHEATILDELKVAVAGLVGIVKDDPEVARAATREALTSKAPIIYQAALEDQSFAGFSDFLILDETGRYQVWDTKLARSPKPYYAIQLCCYSEMLAAMTRAAMPEKFGIILGTKEKVEFRTEDFIHYYRRIKTSFLKLHADFTGKLVDRPEPLAGADHDRWSSHAETFFIDTDHLVQVAGITVGQIKKLKRSNIPSLALLASSVGKTVPKLAAESLEKLAAQASLQVGTKADRAKDPSAIARYHILPHVGPNNEPLGLAALPRGDAADVFFDMEGYPLASGGLEYLFGVCYASGQGGKVAYRDWWAHDRDEEKRALEGFVDWAFARWKASPGMHIYHYASYEVAAVRRLSTRHDTRQDEVDQLLRNNVFVDLLQIVRHGLRIGEKNYSLKTIERLYRPSRVTTVSTAAESMVHYARWIQCREPRDWQHSTILKGIRDYNEDDCQSTFELLQWLQALALKHKIESRYSTKASDPLIVKELPPEVLQRLDAIASLRKLTDPVSLVLADIIDFHRREEKPMYWRMFDRAAATAEELRDDSGCIQGVEAVGTATVDKQSLVQAYRFDPMQECKLASHDRSRVMFCHDTKTKFNLIELDLARGELRLKLGKKTIAEKFGGMFPKSGSLIPDEYVSAETMQLALTAIAEKHLENSLHQSILSLLNRVPPAALRANSANDLEAAIRIAQSMSGDCLLFQGPPGTGKTYTASRVINALIAAGRTVGIASNSHKAVVNLMIACGDAVRENGKELVGIKVGGDDEGPLFQKNPRLRYVEETKDARPAFQGGVIGGTAWLFSRPEWENVLDFLFIDEAGQVSLANVVAMARSTTNIVLLGDQMQLEQPVQGSHPGAAGLSGLQYALMDVTRSVPDSPVFHAVIPPNTGLFLGESHRMHPTLCRFISESIYEGRLASHKDCERQRIHLASDGEGLVTRANGILFSGVEHDGDIQQSDDEVARVVAIYRELLGRPYTGADGTTTPLRTEDFLFIAPYNAQVRSLQAALPSSALVGSVDKLQGQQAPVCILSLCSSYGEYGSRGLAFILDRNRINVALSRAKCLAIVVADPRLAYAEAGSIHEMMLINVLCKVAAF